MDLLQRFALAVVLSCCSETAIAQQTPAPAAGHSEPWWDAPWGEADRLGNVNNLSADGVKRAAGLIRTGKVYALGIPTAPESPPTGAGSTRSSAPRDRMPTTPRTGPSG